MTQPYIPTFKEFFDFLIIEMIYNNGNSPDRFIANVGYGIAIFNSTIPAAINQFLFGWL